MKTIVYLLIYTLFINTGIFCASQNKISLEIKYGKQWTRKDYEDELSNYTYTLLSKKIKYSNRNDKFFYSLNTSCLYKNYISWQSGDSLTLEAKNHLRFPPHKKNWISLDINFKDKDYKHRQGYDYREYTTKISYKYTDNISCLIGGGCIFRDYLNKRNLYSFQSHIELFKKNLLPSVDVKLKHKLSKIFSSPYQKINLKNSFSFETKYLPASFCKLIECKLFYTEKDMQEKISEYHTDYRKRGLKIKFVEEKGGVSFEEAIGVYKTSYTNIKELDNKLWFFNLYTIFSSERNSAFKLGYRIKNVLYSSKEDIRKHTFTVKVNRRINPHWKFGGGIIFSFYKNRQKDTPQKEISLNLNTTCTPNSSWKIWIKFNTHFEHLHTKTTTLKILTLGIEHAF